MGANKRKYERHRKRIRLKYQIEDEKWRTGFTNDISATGLFIVSSTIPSKRNIRVRIEHNNQTVELVGVVLRGKKVPARLRQIVKGGMAIELREIPEAWYLLCQELDEKSRQRRTSLSSSIPLKI